MNEIALKRIQALRLHYTNMPVWDTIYKQMGWAMTYDDRMPRIKEDIQRPVKRVQSYVARELE